MGTNLENKELFDERRKITEEILKILDSWEDEYESSILTVNLIDERIESLKKIDLKFDKEDLELYYDDIYLNNLRKIINKKAEVIQSIEVQKSKLLIEMKKIQKRENIVNNYANKNKGSLFIDKDI